MPPSSKKLSRKDAIPNANSPQLLTHLLEMVARGVRSTRGLQEALGVDQRTVRYYFQAGAWLGFLSDDPEPLLTPEGLGYVYAGAGRRKVYAEAVRKHPFFQDLMERTAGNPKDAAIRAAISSFDPSLADSTVRRRASAVKGLIAPALESVADQPEPQSEPQLELQLQAAPLTSTPAPVSLKHGRSFNPDIYRYMLCYLLDHGELSLGHIRGLLDSAGADHIPIGGYIDLALQRGDAVRAAERLIVSPGAIQRRDLADNTAAVILSDAGWRSHLAALRGAPDQDSPDSLNGPYRPWDRRLFGHEIRPEDLESDLHRILRDRSLDSWPQTTGPSDFTPAQVDAPFLESWKHRDLVIALPPSLAQLWEGVQGVNRRLRNARHRADAIGTPSMAYRPMVVHSGLLHPGEHLPRSVPDARSLRQRLLSNAPYVTLILALLYVHRTRSQGIELSLRKGEWSVRQHRTLLGEPLHVLDGFAKAQGWVPARRSRNDMSAGLLLSLLERLHMVLVVSDVAILEDNFFNQLRNDAEEQELLQHLEPLSCALAEHLETLYTRSR